MRRTGFNFLIGLGIGHLFRRSYDHRKTKNGVRGLEKQKVYREVYGEEAYREKYVYPNQGEPVKYTEEDYLELEYEDLKKNPAIAFFGTLFFGSFGYMYVSVIGFVIAFISNIILLILGIEISHYLFFGNASAEPAAELRFLVSGMLIVRITHTFIATYLTIHSNNEERKKLGLER